MIWFTSDQHFGHENIIEFCGRPFMSKEDMTDALIWNWNHVVNDGDVVYVLGDFAFLPGHAIQWINNHLKGYKILIRGNHDRLLEKSKKDYFGFSDIHEQLDITMDGRTVTLSHYPFRGDNIPEDRFVDRRPTDFGQWLLHGHVHKAWKILREYRMINVGCDVWGYTPINEPTIISVMRGEV